MNEPLISVIVPIYNVEAYLPECIESILNQTYANFECILVDDGSPDRCGAICDEYAKRDSRIKVIHQPNRGVSEARNTGLDAANGQYISFVDSDDWIKPEMLEVLFEITQKYQVQIADAIVLRGAEIQDDRIVVSSGQEMMLRYMRDDLNAFTHSASAYWSPFPKLFEASLWKDPQARFPRNMVYEDLQTIPYVYFHADRAALISKPLYYYRMRENSTMHSKTSPDIVTIVQWLMDYCSEHDISPDTVFSFGVEHLYAYFCREKRAGTSVQEPFFQALRAFLKKHYFGMLKMSEIDTISKLRLSELALFNSIRIPMRKTGRNEE